MTVRSMTPWPRRFSAAFLAAHGVAHSVGFAGPWQLGELADAPYVTTILGGAIELGDAGIRMVGLLWAVAGAAFIGSALVVWRRRPARTALATVTSFSLVVCVLGLPAAVVGLVIDVAILGTLIVAMLARPLVLHGATR